SIQKRLRHLAARFLYELSNGISRALSQAAAIHVNTAHSRICGERNELGMMLGEFATAQFVFLLGQHDNRTPLWRFIGKAGELSSICQFAFAYSVDCNEFDRLPVAQGDGSGLVKKQGIHVPRSLNRL